MSETIRRDLRIATSSPERKPRTRVRERHSFTSRNPLSEIATSLADARRSASSSARAGNRHACTSPLVSTYPPGARVEATTSFAYTPASAGVANRPNVSSPISTTETIRDRVRSRISPTRNRHAVRPGSASLVDRPRGVRE